MCAAADNKPMGILKILNIFLRPKTPPLSQKSSNNDEINNLRTDAVAVTQPNRKSSLQFQSRQTQRNASLPMDLMSQPNLALHSQFSNGAGVGNVSNNFHFSGSKEIHIGNNIQIIQNNSKQVTNNTPERATKPSSSNENGTSIAKSKRFSGEQRRIIESEQTKFIHLLF